MRKQSTVRNVIPSWLPFVAKTVGTVYLLEAPAILLLRMIVLMFVLSKIGWTETFHGIQMRMWAVILAVAAISHLASGITGWVIGIWLARRRPDALRHSRLFVLSTLSDLVWNRSDRCQSSLTIRLNRRPMRPSISRSTPTCRPPSWPANCPAA